MIDLRNTVQRKIILEAMQTMHGHPTAEDVYRGIQKKYPTISKATVYRNLHQLASVGSIALVLIPGSAERFDDRISQHYHFCCRACGGIFDVDIEYLSGINDAVAKQYDFAVDAHDVIFNGICANCRELKEKP